MKKMKLLFMIIATVSVSNMFAKDISEKSNLFGISGGIAITTMGIQKTSTDAKNWVKVGGLAGINFEHRFKKVAAIEIGVNYTNKGAQQKIESSFLNRSYFRLNFHSIEVPLIIKFYLGKKKRFNLNVGGYASYAFNVQSRKKLDWKDNTVIPDTDERKNNLLSKDNNPKDVNGERLFRAYDAGVNVGAEFISKIGLGAGARVSQGLVDYTNPKYILDDSKRIYHTAILLYALWKF